MLTEAETQTDVGLWKMNLGMYETVWWQRALKFNCTHEHRTLLC